MDTSRAHRELGALLEGAHGPEGAGTVSVSALHNINVNVTLNLITPAQGELLRLTESVAAILRSIAPGSAKSAA